MFLLPFPDLIRKSLTVVALALLTCGLLTGPAAANRKTDVIHLRNGDSITGEFKELSQGELKLSTTDMGTIFIKWKAVDWIESDKYIEFELIDGTRLFGTIVGEKRADKGEDDWTIYVHTLKAEPYAIDLSEVVFAEQIRMDDDWRSRLDGYVSLGMNYTKASDVLVWNLEAQAKYRTPQHMTTVTLDSARTIKRKSSENEKETSRHNLLASRIWLQEEHWFSFTGAGVQQNEELGLDWRIIGSAGGGRFLKRTPNIEFYMAAGLAANKEQETGQGGETESLSDSGTNLEGLISVDFAFFRLYTPKSRIKLSATAYPGISDSDRIRATGNASLRQEFVKDLFWELSTYIDYDSKPLQGAEATTDYGIVTSVGYEF